MAIPEWVKTAVWVLGAATFLWSPMLLTAQEIYKTVDENGNVVYTDQKPDDDAVPVTLKELTVVDPVELGDSEAIADGSGNANAEQTADLGLEIVSPAAEETVWNTAYVLSVQVRTERQLPAGAQLAFLIDGDVRSTTRSMSVEIDEVYRGEHQLSVELRGQGGQTLDSAGPVTFFMRQHSRQHPNPG
jgi:hypothetical protein